MENKSTNLGQYLIFSLFLLQSGLNHAEQPSCVYGAAKGLYIQDNHKMYLLQLGAFQSFKNAEQYADKISEIAHATIHKLHIPGKMILYHVSVGPIDAYAVRMLSQKILLLTDAKTHSAGKEPALTFEPISIPQKESRLLKSSLYNPPRQQMIVSESNVQEPFLDTLLTEAETHSASKEPALAFEPLPIPQKESRLLKSSPYKTPRQQMIVPKSDVQEHFLDTSLNIKNLKLSLSFGGFHTDKSLGDQSLGIPGLNGEIFTITSQQKGNYLLGAGVVLNKFSWEKINLSYGLSSYYLASTKVSGEVYQEKLYNNLSYEYRVSNIPVYLSTKTEFKPFTQAYSGKYTLLWHAGLGLNVMQVSNFKETSLDGITDPEYILATNTTSAGFSAMTGVSLRINQAIGQLPLECGYQIFSLNKEEININTGQHVSYPTIMSGSNFSQALVCSLTF